MGDNIVHRTSKNKRKSNFSEEIDNSDQITKRKKSGKKCSLPMEDAIATTSKQKRHYSVKRKSGIIPKEIEVQAKEKSSGNNNAIPIGNKNIDNSENELITRSNCKYRRAKAIEQSADLSKEITVDKSDNSLNSEEVDVNDNVQDDGINIDTTVDNTDKHSIQDSDSEGESNEDENSQASSDEGEIDDNESEESEDDEEVVFNEVDLRLKIKRDPNYKRIMEEMVQEKLQKEKKKLKKSKKRGKVDDQIPNTDKCVSKQVKPNSPIVKSPSDSTLYTPALRKISERTQMKNTDIIDQISDFVDNIRLQSTRTDFRKDKESNGTPKSSRYNTDTRRVESKVVRPDMRRQESDDDEEIIEARSKEASEKLVVEAEQLKANLIAPKGMLPIVIDENIEMLRKLDNDDDFFYISCHIDPALKSKIEQGDFVDLEKLLPKEKSANGYSMHDDSRLGIFHQDGETFYAPLKKDSGITSLKKWDAAFRIYATIYTKANPGRSAEIWQYVHIIHTIASSHSWESVSFYDFTFRRLMAEKPWRSWAKTYTQGWNIALNGNINTMSRKSSGEFNQKFTPRGGNGNNQKHDWRDDCCWGFNKTHCNKTGQECKFDHRCTFCGIWNHGRKACRKRLRRDNSNNGGNSYNRGPTPQKSAATTTTTNSTSATDLPKN